MESLEVPHSVVPSARKFSPKLALRAFVLWLCCLCFFSPELSATSPEDSSIKVAYILDEGFYTTEENGGLSGYNYDFLMLLAQHTGWTYEFIQVDEDSMEASQAKAEEMLLAGEVDLLGSVFRTEENLQCFQFPDQNTGICRYNLVSLVNNYKITQDNYFLQDALTVALVEGEEVNETFLTLIVGRDLEVEILYVDSHEEALSLLVKEEVEAILNQDTSTESWMLNYLTTVERVPFYFVAQQGNTEITQELDRVLEKISVEEPNIHQRLLGEYFSTSHQGPIILTKEEEDALEDYDYLTVGLLKGREPYQFYNGEDEEVPAGISVDILEQISQIIGMEFRYVWLDSRQEMKEAIANETIDLCSTVPYDSDFQLTYFFDVVITQPYLTNAMVWLHKQGETGEADPHYYYLADNIPFFPDEELIEILDFEAALEKLSEQGGLSIFADPYMAQYMLQKLNILNVEMQTVSSVQSKICFGVGKHLDSAVVGLINHSLLHIDSFVADEIIYNNVTVEQGLTVEAFLRSNTVNILLLVILICFFVVMFLVRNSRKLRKITQEDSLTHLYNAGYFHEYAGEKVKKLEKGCLILIDIDYFKQVNDTYGHQQGDTVIIEVANTLKRHFRQEDVVARLGGDEFIVLLEYQPRIDLLNARCKDILKELAQDDNSVPVSLSIGGYLFHEPMDYKTLYKSADKVLYQVKEKGRNGYAFASGEELPAHRTESSQD